MLGRPIAALILLMSTTAAAAQPAPPPTRTNDVRETLHGVEIADPYRWLEDQQSPETRKWIEAQNRHTLESLEKLPGREQLQRRLSELLKVDAMSAPLGIKGRYFFTKRRADQDLAVIYLRRGLKGKDRVLVDPHGMSADHSTSVGISAVSPDGTLMAYSVRKGGADEVEIRFLNVDTGKELPDVLPPARYFSISIAPDNGGFYYTRHGQEGPRIYFHRMGSPVNEDRLVFGEGYGIEKLASGSLSEDGRYFVITVSYGSAAQKTELWIQNVAEGGPVKPLVNDLDATFYGDVASDTLFMLTDWNAPNRRILKVDLKNPGREHWKEIIPTGDGVILGLSPVGGRLFVNYLENVQSRVAIFSPEGKSEGEIRLPQIGTVSGIGGRWDQDEAFFSFSSYPTPATIYRYKVSSGKREVWDRIRVPVKSGDFEVKQVWFNSKDGTRVPMFLVHRKGMKRDGARPVLLTGYGGFNSSLTPGFSSIACLWAEAGGVFAVPNLRGGGEFGEAWHRAGMKEKKQNVFDDFIAAAEWLIAERYTNPEKLAISGGSNGGLLVGAALTQRPELFRAVMCSYPLLDMVRYHQFLVARFWVPEYGSSENPEEFRYLHAYSPYHRVKKGTSYPAVLFVTGDADTRVDPLHARKMAALLQSAQGGERPILLDYDTQAGHSGGKPLSKQIEDLSRQYGFLFWQLGVDLERELGTGP